MANQVPQPKYITRQEAAKVYRCSLATIDRWIANGELLSRKFGGRRLIEIRQPKNQLA
jgi:excisionase family DNA binding protein